MLLHIRRHRAPVAQEHAAYALQLALRYALLAKEYVQRYAEYGQEDYRQYPRYLEGRGALLVDYVQNGDYGENREYRLHLGVGVVEIVQRHNKHADLKYYE